MGNIHLSVHFASWMLASPTLALLMHSAKHSSSAIHIHRGQQWLKMRMDKNSKSFSYMLLTSPLMKAKGFYWLLCLSLYQSHYMLCSLRCHSFGRSCYHPNTQELRAECAVQMGKHRRALPPSIIVGVGISIWFWLCLLPAPSVWANLHYRASENVHQILHNH